MRIQTLILMSAIALVASGCGAGPKYYWGSYEDLVYVHYADQGKISPQEQIKTMEEDLRDAGKAHKPVPPGFHAQLGYLYSLVGNKEAAKSNFETEKQRFPESTVLMDRLITNLARS